jgi:hypothetical protein
MHHHGFFPSVLPSFFSSSFVFFSGQGIELKPSWLLGRRSTTWATVVATWLIFQYRVSLTFLTRLALILDPPISTS